jgi:hypothetical protein
MSNVREALGSVGVWPARGESCQNNHKNPCRIPVPSSDVYVKARIGTGEADMATQLTNSQKSKLVLTAALVGLAILIVLASTDIRTTQAGCPVATLLGAALQEIPCALVEAGMQALQVCLFDHQAFLQDFQRMLVSFWLLLVLVLGTALTRSSFRSNSEGSSTPSK